MPVNAKGFCIEVGAGNGSTWQESLAPLDESVSSMSSVTVAISSRHRAGS
jgi:hypothetical protein